MLIGGLQKFSLLDYPGKISCIVFTPGCNFSCGYCHNPELLDKPSGIQLLEEEKFFAFLNSRKGKLDAVVITGGEPTIHPDLPDFIGKLKKLKFLVKLDTNGTNPEMVSLLMEKGLLDYIAMDIKAPLIRYNDITYRKVDLDKIQQSIAKIIGSKIDYEFRTTVVKDQLTRKDFEQIAQLLKGAKRYYLQKFIASKTNRPEFMQKESYDDKTLAEFAEMMSENIKEVFVR